MPVPDHKPLASKANRRPRAPDLSFSALLEQVKKKTLAAFDHQEVPFEQVVARVAPRRDPAFHPLFQVLLNVIYHEDTLTDCGDLRMEREWLADPETKFDFTLYAVQHRDSWDLRIVYNRDLFPERRVSGWLKKYESLMEKCLATPEAPVPIAGEAAQPLPAPVSHADNATPGMADGGNPASITERVVAEAWCSVLERQSVAGSDHFFEIGGHSLLGMMALRRIRRHASKPIPQSFIFRYPVLRDLAEAIDRQQAPELPPIQRQGALILTPAQKAIWRFQRDNPASAAYYVPRAVRIHGTLDLDFLREALRSVVARHPILRTAYPADADGCPRPCLIEPSAIGMEVLDLSRSRPGDREALEARHLMAHVRTPLDLTSDIPLRALLLKWTDREWTLAVTTHHIAADCWSMGLPFQAIEETSDPWSMGVFFSELLEYYGASVEVREPKPRELPVEYSDVAAWRQENCRTGLYDGHSAYWKQQLSGAPFTIPLPTDRPRPAQFDYAGGRQEFAPPQGLYEKVAMLARRHGTTPYAVFLHAFGLCIREWTGQEDFIIGTPVANRQQPETRDLIGLMANTILLRMNDLEEGPSALSRRTRELHRAFQYQDYPVEYVLEDLEMRPGPADPPQVQLRFVMQHARETPPAASSLSLSPVRIDRGVSKHDLSLVLAIHGVRLRGWCEYNTNIFEASTIHGVAERYLQILDRMLSWA